MTENEWLAGDHPRKMMDVIHRRQVDASIMNRKAFTSDRKLRLLDVACCYAVWPLLTEKSCKAIEIAERYADGKANDRELRRAQSMAYEVYDRGMDRHERPHFRHGDGPPLSREGIAAAMWAWMAAEITGTIAGRVVVMNYDDGKGEISLTSTIIRASIIQDIFGNPWKPHVVVTPIAVSNGYHHMKRDQSLVSIGEVGKIKMFNNAWLTDDVIAIAQHIYDKRDFAAMPVLGDALEQAGCTDLVVLEHCRGVTTGNPPRNLNIIHGRGCWVLDLILGKD